MAEIRSKTLAERAKECRELAKRRPDLKNTYLRLAARYAQLASEAEIEEQHSVGIR